MKRFILLLIAILISVTIMSSNIIYKTNEAIFLYNVEKKEFAKLINCDKYFSIGSIFHKGDSIFFILYNDIEFTASSPKRIIYEKEYLIKDKKCILLANNYVTLAKENNIINPANDKLQLESFKINGEKSSSIIIGLDVLYERYYRHYEYSDIDSILNYNWKEGSVSILANGKWNCLFKGTQENDILCAYYEPDLSSDRKYLICIYQCSKYNRRKIIGDTKLLEMNIENGLIQDLSFLSGSSPKYSKNGQYILYRNNKKKGFSIYNRNNNSVMIISDAHEVYWVR